MGQLDVDIGFTATKLSVWPQFNVSTIERQRPERIGNDVDIGALRALTLPALSCVALTRRNENSTRRL